MVVPAESVLLERDECVRGVSILYGGALCAEAADGMKAGFEGGYDADEKGMERRDGSGDKDDPVFNPIVFKARQSQYWRLSADNG